MDVDPKMDRSPQPPCPPENEPQDAVFSQRVGADVGDRVGPDHHLAVAPLLTRLYDPKDFGIFGVYVSIVGIISAQVPTLRYDQALMLPKRTEDAANLFGVSGVCVAGVTVLAAFVCIPFAGSIAAMTQIPKELSRWLWLIPISVFLLGAIRELQFVVNAAEAVSSGLDFPSRSERRDDGQPSRRRPRRSRSDGIDRRVRFSETPVHPRPWARKCSRTTLPCSAVRFAPLK